MANSQPNELTLFTGDFDLTNDLAMFYDNSANLLKKVALNRVLVLQSSGQVGSNWINVSFNTGWGNYGGGYNNAQYKKVGDLVFLRGLVARSSGTETKIFTLPSGYRPTAQCLFSNITNGGQGRIDVETDGDVQYVSGGYSWVQLDGLVFSIV